MAKKIRVSWSAEYDEETWKALVAYGSITGHDFDHPGERTVVQRLLREQGVAAVDRAKEYAKSEAADEEDAKRRCGHCHSTADHVACHKCMREMCEDCISFAPDGSGKVCGLCYDGIAEEMQHKLRKIVRT